MSHDASITVIVGMRGSGKSTLAASKVKKLNHPVIVIDPTGNWAKDLDVDETQSLRAVAGKIDQYWKHNFRIVFVPHPELSPTETLHHLSKLIMEAQAGYKAGTHTRQIEIVVEEANIFYPSHRLTQQEQGFTSAILQGRHWGINITAITQRPQLISTNLRGNASVTYCLALSDDRAISSVMEQCGAKNKVKLQELPLFKYLKIEGRSVTTHAVPKPRK